MIEVAVSGPEVHFIVIFFLVHYKFGHEAFEDIHVPLDTVVDEGEGRYVFEVWNSN